MMSFLEPVAGMRRPDVLLVQPPMEWGPSLAGSGEALGLELLATVLRQRGYTVKVLDTFLLNMTLDQIVDALLQYRPTQLLGFSLQVMDMYERVVEILAALPPDYHQVFTVVGGHAATFWHREILADCPHIDAAVRVEGEGPILELMDFLALRRPLREIAGLAIREGGETVLTPARPLLPDLAVLPRIQRDTLRLGMAKLGVVAEVQTSRGCYGTCSFCNLHSFYAQHPGLKMRFRAIDDILDEVEHLYHHFGVRCIRFADDTFFTQSAASRKRAMAIADGLIARQLHIRFVIQLRADAVDAGVLLRLREAGLRLIMVGIEALDEESLALYGKYTTCEMNYRAAQVLATLGIRFRACYITFNPFTTVEHLRSSVRFFRSLAGPHQCDHLFNKLYVLKGTPIAETLMAAGLLRSGRYCYEYDFVDADIARIWTYCDAYVPIFTPLKREIGALWEWWFQHSDETDQEFGGELERCEHALTDHHLYFLESLIEWVTDPDQAVAERLLAEMRERVDDIAVRVAALYAAEAARGRTIRIYQGYTYDPADLTYGLADDLRGIEA